MAPSESTFWQGVFAPAGTPPALIAKLNAVVHRIAAMPETKEFYGRLGAELSPSTPDELAATLNKEIVKWAKIAKDIGLAVD